MPRYLRAPSYRDYGGYDDDPYASRSVGSSPIARIYMQQGQDAASAALHQGDIWGEAVHNIGGMLSDASKGYGQHLQQEQVKKEEHAKQQQVKDQEAQRAQALNQMLEQTQGRPGPRDFINIFGLERGLEIGKAWSTMADKQQKVNIPVLARGILNLPDESASAGWPTFMQRVESDYPGITETAPKEFDRAWLEKMLPQFENPNPEYGTAAPGAMIYDKRTGEPKTTVPVEAKPDTRNLDLQAEEALQNGDQAGYDRIMKVKKDAAAAGRAPAAPKAGGGEISPEAPKEWRNVLERVGSGMRMKFGRQRFDHFANQLLQEGNIEELKSYTRQAAIESEPAEMKNQIVARMALNESLNSVEQELKGLVARGFDLNKVTGSIEDLARLLGTSSNPALTQIGVRLDIIHQNYRRAMTGAVFSTPEDREYKRIIPNYHDTLPVDLAKIRGMKKESGARDYAYWKLKVGDDGVRLLGIGGPESFTDQPPQRPGGARPIPPGARPGQGRGGAIPDPMSTREAPIQVQSIAEAMKLKKGTVFIDPNGERRVR